MSLSGSSAGLVALVGPTATGKSDLGLSLAVALDGEVINADSMQLYRGMDIGTAKLSESERRGVPHHLLDVLDVTETSTVADFKVLAESAIQDCALRGRRPVLVGGSGLYVRAVADDLDFPGTDEEVRRELEADLDRDGPWALHQRLLAADPAAAAAILPSNGRRVVRALEVIAITGQPYTARLPGYPVATDVVQIGLSIAPDALDARIEARVDAMWEGGLVEEVRRLVGVGLREGRTASRALGYRQVLAYLAGKCTEEQARLDTVVATRRFARRQNRWFSRDPRIRWLPYDAPGLVDDALGVIEVGHVRQ